MNNLDKIKDFAEKFDKFRNHLREECTKPSVSSTNSEAHKENKNKFDSIMILRCLIHFYFYLLIQLLS